MLNPEVIKEALEILNTYFFKVYLTTPTSSDAPPSPAIQLYNLAATTNYVYLNDTRLIEELVEKIEEMKAMPLLMRLRSILTFLTPWSNIVHHYIQSSPVDIHPEYTVNYDQLYNEVVPTSEQDEYGASIQHNDIVVVLFLMSLIIP